MTLEQGVGRVTMFGDHGSGYRRGADVLHRLDAMGAGDDWTTTHRYEPFASNAEKARQFLREAITGIPLDQELVVLAGSELVTNAIRHAQTPFTVDVSIRADRLRIRVTDSSSRLPVVRPVNLDAAGGLGLNIVAFLSVAWGTDTLPGGKTVWFENGHQILRTPRSPCHTEAVGTWACLAVDHPGLVRNGLAWPGRPAASTPLCNPAASGQPKHP